MFLSLSEKAVSLLRIARSIQHENYWNDVTVEEQTRLEEVVKGIDASAKLLMLHVRSIETKSIQRRRRIVAPSGKKPKLRVVK
jgi:hypothetical protein